jgi:hypothetical protein
MYIGPPYKIAESIFDEYDQEACHLPGQEPLGIFLWQDGIINYKKGIVRLRGFNRRKVS